MDQEQSQVGFIFQKGPNFYHGYAACSELPSCISAMIFYKVGGKETKIDLIDRTGFLNHIINESMVLILDGNSEIDCRQGAISVI